MKMDEVINLLNTIRLTAQAGENEGKLSARACFSMKTNAENVIAILSAATVKPIMPDDVRVAVDEVKHAIREKSFDDWFLDKKIDPIETLISEVESKYGS